MENEKDGKNNFAYGHCMLIFSTLYYTSVYMLILHVCCDVYSYVDAYVMGILCLTNWVRTIPRKLLSTQYPISLGPADTNTQYKY